MTITFYRHVQYKYTQEENKKKKNINSQGPLVQPNLGSHPISHVNIPCQIRIPSPHILTLKTLLKRPPTSLHLAPVFIRIHPRNSCSIDRLILLHEISAGTPNIFYEYK